MKSLGALVPNPAKPLNMFLHAGKFPSRHGQKSELGGDVHRQYDKEINTWSGKTIATPALSPGLLP